MRGPVSGHEQYEGMLCIPTLGPYGPVALKFRCLKDHDCKTEGHVKYLGESQGTRLFNVRAVREAEDSIHITEGEIDAIILEQCGFHAIGVTGANNWKRHHPRLFADFSKVFVWGDGDKAGAEFSKKVSDTLRSAHPVKVGAGYDVNRLYVESGVEAIREAAGIEC